jgi:hypothetical protein
MNAMRIRLFLSAILLVFGQYSFSQYFGKKEIKAIRNHVFFLASDKLEGRYPGTAGEAMAADYIVSRWKKTDIRPGGENGSWYREFRFTERIEADTSCALLINGTPYFLNADFWPLSYSAEGQLNAETVYLKYGIRNPEKGYDDYQKRDAESLKGKIFVIELGGPDGIHPHSAHINHSSQEAKVKKAVESGAAAVIFIDTKNENETPGKEFSKSVKAESIPCLYATGKAADMLRNGSATGVSISIKINRLMGSGKNVIGFIDNRAHYQVIIGAHYDHLGWGGEGSLHKGDPAIHNGADDNASGTAALIELGKYLAKKGPKNNNYVLVAFSAEEKGLLGSNDFVKSSLFDPAKANYMLNLDMVGRLEKDRILINAAGTSSMWGNNLNAVKGGRLTFKTTESGTGPSDHTSFYLKNIPVLHFFTGTHADYHKPGDDAEKVNMEGIARVADFIVDLIALLDPQGKLDFVKTKETESTKAPKFSVTLGIVPDYLYEGEGVKADGVSEGKPAQKAGVQAGDVLIRLGEYPIRDMKSYMEALGKFKKGESTTLELIRAGQKMSVSVQF